MRKWRSEAGVGGEVEHRAAGPCAVVVCSPNHQLETSLPARCCTHGTGLEGDVEGAVGKPPVARHPTCSAKGDELGVGRRVGTLLASISGAGDDLTAPNNDGTDRHLSTLCGGLGLDQGFGHEMPIVIIEDPIGEHGSRITKGPR